MGKHAVEKLPFVIAYVPEQYKTQKMCGKAVLENDEVLESVPDWYKNQQICDKTVDIYLHALKFTPDDYITKRICDKHANTYHPILIAIRLKNLW